jgi:hypothetical protein
MGIRTLHEGCNYAHILNNLNHSLHILALVLTVFFRSSTFQDFTYIIIQTYQTSPLLSVYRFSLIMSPGIGFGSKNVACHRASNVMIIMLKVVTI